MFNWLKKKKASPGIRDVLFGDLPFSRWPQEPAAQDEPWRSFVEARTHLYASKPSLAIQILQRVLATPDLESRHYLQAWHFLRGLGIQPPPVEAKKLYGVVVEVALSNGLDILAAYADRTARYFNYSGAAIIWERPDDSLDQTIDGLLETGQVVVEKLSPWESSRPPAPPKGQCRINLLTPSGLHFGQGALKNLAGEPMAEPVMTIATRLMQELIAKKEKNQA